MDQQVFSFGQGVSKAISFFYQHSQELVGLTNPCILQLKVFSTAQEAHKERVIEIYWYHGLEGKFHPVTLVIRRQNKDNAVINDWKVVKADGWILESTDPWYQFRQTSVQISDPATID